MRANNAEPGVMVGSEYYVHEISQTALMLHYYIAAAGHYHCETGYRIRGQYVDSIIVMYVEQGEMEVEYQGKHYIAPPGSVILLDRNEPHHYFVSQYAEFYWINIGGCNCPQLCSYLNRHFGAVHKGDYCQPIGIIIRSILSKFKCNQVPVEAELSWKIHEILCRLIPVPQAVQASNPAHSAAQDAADYIRDHLSCCQLDLNTIANHVGLSTTHLIRLFQKEFGCTPHAYVIRLRMEHTKYLLKTTAMPVKQIARESGYSNVSSFVSAFTEKVGISPQQYRKLPLE